MSTDELRDREEAALLAALQTAMLTGPSRHSLRTDDCPVLPRLLSAAQDGFAELTAAERAHVTDCDYCQLTFERAYRRNHLSPAAIAEAIAGDSPGARALAAHREQCPSCERRVHSMLPATREETLLERRVRLGITRDRVTEFLVEALEIPAENRESVAVAYHELESGLLDTGRISAQVWSVLAELFGADPDELRRSPIPPALPEPAADHADRSEAAAPHERLPYDEQIEMLFYGRS